VVGIAKRLVVLNSIPSDRLDSPAGVIRSLFQADPFPCSVASLGRTDLFKALEPSAYAKNPMATRNLIRAPGKREISASPQPIVAPIQPRCPFTGYTRAIATLSFFLYTHPPPQFSLMGSTPTTHHLFSSPLPSVLDNESMRLLVVCVQTDIMMEK
jgi:hypothetical protein